MRDDITNTMKGRPDRDVFFTAMIDLYGLPRGFADHELAGTEASPFGKRYVVKGIMNTPARRPPCPGRSGLAKPARRRPGSSRRTRSGGTTMNELDTVVLTQDLPGHGLLRGDLGTVMLVHDRPGYEVEFMTLDGETLGVVSLTPQQVRPVRRREIARARVVQAG
jgi:hypothetical protein